MRQQGGPTTVFKRLSYIYICENKRYICKVDFFDCFDPKFLLILNMSQSASCWGVFDFQCDSQVPILTVFTCRPLPSTSATGSSHVRKHRLANVILMMLSIAFVLLSYRTKTALFPTQVSCFQNCHTPLIKMMKLVSEHRMPTISMVYQCISYVFVLKFALGDEPPF